MIKCINLWDLQFIATIFGLVSYANSSAKKQKLHIHIICMFLSWV